MKKLHLKFFAVILSLIFVLSNSGFTSLATEVTEEEYLAPYIAMFDQYVEESGVDAQIGDIDLLYGTCKNLSLSEWKSRLDEIFESFKTISKNEEPIVLHRDNNTQFRPCDSGFDGGVPGVSATSSYNSVNNGVPGVSSTDSSEGVYLESLFESEKNGAKMKPFSAMFIFNDTFTGYIQSDYKFKITVTGNIANEGMNNVINNATWQAWNFPGENYYYVSQFKNTINNGDTASTDAVGFLMTAEGFMLAVQITMPFIIYANNYYG